MGRVRSPPSREPHRTRRDRGPEGHRLVCRRGMDRHCHLVGQTKAEPSLCRRHGIYGNPPYRVDLCRELEAVEREGRGAD